MSNKLVKIFLTIGIFSMALCSCAKQESNDESPSSETTISEQTNKSSGSETSSTDNNTYHTIVWLNYDNSLLFKDTKVVEGEIPVYTGETPSKPSTQQYNYTFSGWSPDVVPAYIDATYVAQFSSAVNKYTVTWECEDGSVLLTEEYDYGSTPSFGQNVPDIEKSGYRYSFKAWDPTISKVTGDTTYTATYGNKTPVSYKITYNLNGGTNSSSNPSSYTVESNITFQSVSRAGYQFDGWYKGNDKVTGIAPGSSTGDVVIDARWIALKNTLSVTCQDSSKGTVAIKSGSGYSGETIIIEATPTSGFVFNGWYQGTTLVSKLANYTFAMPANNYSLTARFLTQAEEEIEEERNKNLGISPVIDSTKHTITYGLYPQKNVDDSALISSLNALTAPASNGWYLYNNEYYAKINAVPLRSGYKFDNEITIVKGSIYWFKCEPITWNILNNNNGEYYLLSSLLLDAHLYATSSNNYKNSEIRSWLNNEFYNSAFALQNSYIKTTNVDNSASTTESDGNQYACENTQDKVFLPSYQDYLNSGYGFDRSTVSTTTRQCKTTDWVRARGVYLTNAVNPGHDPINGSYWTRSPSSNRSTYANSVDLSGNLNDTWGTVDSNDFGVRPAVTFSMTK